MNTLEDHSIYHEQMFELATAIEEQNTGAVGDIILTMKETFKGDPVIEKMSWAYDNEDGKTVVNIVVDELSSLSEERELELNKANTNTHRSTTTH